MLHKEDMAVQLAQAYGLRKQGADEDDTTFRDRISAWLKDRNKVIEAHEALSGRRYDDGHGDVQCGLMGLVGMLLGGVDYMPRSSLHALGDEIAAGMHMGYGSIRAEPVPFAIHDRKFDTFYLTDCLDDPDNEPCLVIIVDKDRNIAELKTCDDRVYIGCFDTNGVAKPIVAKFVIDNKLGRSRIFA